MSIAHFSQLSPTEPDLDAVGQSYDDFLKALDDASTAAETLAVVEAWDALRRTLDSWSSLTRLHYRQDTSNEARKVANDRCDEVTPQLIDFEVRLKRRLLEDKHLDAVVEHYGEHVCNLWRCDVSSFDPAIKEDMIRCSKLKSRYTELRASAQIPFQGQNYTLTGLGRFMLDADRQVRYEANLAKWRWFEAHGDDFDGIFDDLVKTRTKMAHTLGCKDFVELGYQWMHRVDYDRNDVERFRKQVRDHLVPLTAELRRQQASRLGLDAIHSWDEGIFDSQGAPKPKGDTPWIIDQGRTIFDALGHDPAHFYNVMADKGLLDLDSREGKANGGFCTAFPDMELPFIFANFNGTMGDIRVFIHELGHAFQYWSSRQSNISEYLWPTYEAAEIHSMSLEFLTWPHMEHFFAEDADRYRQSHLTFALTFIPYGVAVDHFQHLVYANPDASPADRHAMWKQMEETYLPERRYGDLAYPAMGGLWQQQSHIYGAPFYYIDYTLAQTCALQFWNRSLNDPKNTLQTYVELCKRGGSAPFQTLARSADLISPFDEGCLVDTVRNASAVLGV